MSRPLSLFSALAMPRGLRPGFREDPSGLRDQPRSGPPRTSAADPHTCPGTLVLNDGMPYSIPPLAVCCVCRAVSKHHGAVIRVLQWDDGPILGVHKPVGLNVDPIDPTFPGRNLVQQGHVWMGVHPTLRLALPPTTEVFRFHIHQLR